MFNLHHTGAHYRTLHIRSLTLQSNDYLPQVDRQTRLSSHIRFFADPLQLHAIHVHTQLRQRLHAEKVQAPRLVRVPDRSCHSLHHHFHSQHLSHSQSKQTKQLNEHTHLV
jgi:hypothetical protein